MSQLETKDDLLRRYFYRNEYGVWFIKVGENLHIPLPEWEQAFLEKILGSDHGKEDADR